MNGFLKSMKSICRERKTINSVSLGNRHNKLPHSVSLQLSRFLLKLKSGKNSANLLAGEKGVQVGNKGSEPNGAKIRGSSIEETLKYSA